MFILSGITWLKDNKNLPIVSLSLILNYKFMSRVIPQIEAWKSLISEISISRQTDDQTGSWNKFANLVVKLIIFDFIRWKCSRDLSWNIDILDQKIVIWPIPMYQIVTPFQIYPGLLEVIFLNRLKFAIRFCTKLMRWFLNNLTTKILDIKLCQIYDQS